MNEIERYQELMDLLPVGEDYAVSMKEVAYLFDMDERALRKYVEAARTAGCVIGASNEGYFIPGNADELRRYIRRHEARIKTGERSVRAAKEKLREMGEEDQQHDGED